MLLYHEFVFWAGGLTLHNKQYLILSIINVQVSETFLYMI